MSGRNVNIYFQEKNYEKVKNLIEQRKVSQLINQLVTEWSQKEQQQNKEEIKKRLVADYQAQVKNKELQKELDEAEETQLEDF